MHNIDQLPVLILAYNRFGKFKRCINTLHKYGVRKVFISIDGPKNSNDYLIQKRIISFCEENNLDLQIKINYYEKNLGCRLGPIKGITWFFKNNPYGVIFEDDVLISYNCLLSFSFLLQKYKSNNTYMSLSSFNELSSQKKEYIYSMPVWRSWGWGSWADKWNEHLQLSKRNQNLGFWQLYNLLPDELKSIKTINILKTCQLNLMDAWDYEFNFSHIIKRYKSLTVGGINNFVYGFDSSATHTIDLQSLGIDFDLFIEREIDLSKIISYDYKKAELILSKCGFNYLGKKTIKNKLSDFIKGFGLILILRLRILKRFIYRILFN